VSSHAPFGLIMVDSLPDLHVLDTGQFFGRWRYEEVKAAPGADSIFGHDDADGGYRRIDNITDAALRTFAAIYGNRITKDDVFYYVYGLLYSSEYREMHAADLKKTLPRTPLVADPWPFIEAGRALSALHLGYETAKPTTSAVSASRLSATPTTSTGLPSLRTPRSRSMGSPSTTRA
jgi:predicted helicase